MDGIYFLLTLVAVGWVMVWSIQDPDKRRFPSPFDMREATPTTADKETACGIGLRRVRQSRPVRNGRAPSRLPPTR
jgi:hypothetical protein